LKGVLWYRSLHSPNTLREDLKGELKARTISPFCTHPVVLLLRISKEN